jgi:DNA-binding response OmpR family regulator
LRRGMRSYQRRGGGRNVTCRGHSVCAVKKHSQAGYDFSRETMDTGFMARPGAKPKELKGHMLKIAVIEDDLPTSKQLKGWIESAKSDIRVDQWFTRDDAEAAIEREAYDLVVLDIELGRERHAGVAIINAINKRGQGTPVLVVSAMPATIYRSIMKALDAWDYLQKATFEESDFIDTFLEILRAAKDRKASRESAPAAAEDELSIDPLRQRNPIWRGQRINLPLTAQRILAALHEKRGQVVSYDDLFQVVKSGRNRDNIRKHVSTIRDAFREADAQFDQIENVPMRGFRWMEQAAKPTRNGK